MQLPSGALPLLAPMSEVAGRIAPQVGAYHLMAQGGGRGTLMGGVSGVYAAKVVVIGAGVSGMNAAAIALGMQAEVLLLDRNIDKLRDADKIYQGHLQTVASNAFEVERAVLDADLVIGAVLVPGAKAPTVVTNALVARMKPGSVLVDIAIDQGGCFEDSRPTTHAEPTFRVHDSIFYCVANMPGAVPHTSTYALTNVTLPYAVSLADRGWQDALRRRPGARPRPQHPRRRSWSAPRSPPRTASATASSPTSWPSRRGRGRARRVRGPAAGGAVARLVQTYLDHLVVERGVSRHTLQAYRRDLRRYAAFLAGEGVATPRP